jgi:hypothetical protein
MAFLGDFGKMFGLGSTQDVVKSVALTAAGVPPSITAPMAFKQSGTQQGQSVAVSQAPQTRPAETQSSGSNVGTSQQGSGQFLGYSDMGGSGFESVYSGAAPAMQAKPAGLPAVVAGGMGVSRGLYGMLFGGAVGAAPMIIDAFTGEPKKLRVTRKLQRDVRQAVMLLGPEAVANQLGVGLDVVIYIMQKKIRNDGPYVTKAAVRKTRQTVRKMKSMCDLYDDLRPAAKRRAPMKRATTTRITNVK